MLSGMNPGRHGIFDFRNLDLRHYTGHDETLANADSYAVPTLFDYLTAADLRTVAYGVPMTYPPRPLNGIMVAGYPTPDNRRAYTFPTAVAAKLSPLQAYSPDQIGSARPEEQAAMYRRSMETMTGHLLELIAGGVDVLMFVNGATDGAQHRFFKFAAPNFPQVTDQERERYAPLLDQIMIAADQQLGRLLDQLPDNIHTLVISDHGAMPRPVRAFNLNAWLAQAGWLAQHNNGTAYGIATAAGRRKSQQLVEWAKQTLPISDWVKRRLPAGMKQRIIQARDGLGNIDWSHTQAFRVKMSHPFEGIHLNIAGRQPQGIVPQPEYPSLRQAIMDRLAHRPEIVAVKPREAVYAGPYMENAPDILVHLEKNYDGGADLDQVVTEIPAGWLQRISGYHTLDGILVAAGPAFINKGSLSPTPPTYLRDIAPTVLHLLGLNVPEEMDGRVLSALFREQRPVQYGPGLPHRDLVTDGTLSADEEAGILAALRDLGYID
jgi:predicted AlkP superfamily phosphohydrolase/phosphomutase